MGKTTHKMRLILRALVAQRVALIAVAAVALSACGSRTNRFSGNGYAFDYPGNWRPRTSLTFEAATGAGALSKEAVGLDDLNLAVVLTTRLDRSVTTQRLPQLAVQAATDLRQVASRGGGSVTQGPDAVTIAGLPGFRFQLSGIQEGSTRVDGRLILAFRIPHPLPAHAAVRRSGRERLRPDPANVPADGAIGLVRSLRWTRRRPRATLSAPWVESLQA